MHSSLSLSPIPNRLAHPPKCLAHLDFTFEELTAAYTLVPANFISNWRTSSNFETDDMITKELLLCIPPSLPLYYYYYYYYY